MPRVTIPEDTRTFQRVNAGGKQLCRTLQMIPGGTTFDVSEPVMMVYDHRDQLAVSFLDCGKEYFLIVSEMNVPSLIQ